MKQIIRLTESDLHRIVNTSVNRLLSESFDHWKSPKLANIVKQHGMPIGDDPSTHYMLTQLTDDDISDDVVDKPNGWKNLQFNDGKYLDVSTKNNKVARDYMSSPACNFHNDYAKEIRPHDEFMHAKMNNPHKNYGDFYSREHYKPMTSRGKDANDLRHNPYFLRDKDKQPSYYNKDEWNKETANMVMNNLRSGKDRLGRPNKKL